LKFLRFFLAWSWVFAVATAARSEDRLSVIGSIVVEAGEKSGEVNCFGCSVRVRGLIQGDIVAIGGDIEVDGTVAGDLVAVGGTIRLGPKAILSGDAVAIGGFVQKDEAARVAGEQVPLPWFGFPGQRHLHWRGVLSLMGMELVPFLISYAIVRRRRVENMASTFGRHPIGSLVVGLGLIGAATLLYIGADKLKRWSDYPGWGITGLLMIIFALGYVGLSYWVGCKWLREQAPFGAALAGAIALLVLQLVPVVGSFAFILMFILAAGCAALSGFGSVRRGAAPASERAAS
jgi:hypothetical protein